MQSSTFFFRVVYALHKALCVCGMQLTPTSPTSPSAIPSLIATPKATTATVSGKSGKMKMPWKKGIPTLLGLGVLVLGLVVGIVVFGSGTGVFAPRASAEMSPKNVKITNVTDRSFSVVFDTDAATSAFIKYGNAANSTKTQISDDRDQITGSVKPYPLHHVTVTGLEPQTKYYFVIGTNTSSLFDDDGKPFEVSTAKRANAPPAAKTIYGSVLTQAGGPAAGAIVFVKLEGAGEMSTLVRDSGSWAIPLSNARTADGAAYANIQPDNVLVINFKGTKGEKQQLSTTVDSYQNGLSVNFGKPIAENEATPSGEKADNNTAQEPGSDAAGLGNTATPSGTPAVTPSVTATPSGTITPTISLSPSPTASVSGTPTPSTTPAASNTATKSATSSSTDGNSNLGGLLNDNGTATPSADQTATPSAKTVVDLDSGVKQVVTTSQPIIQGSAPPKVKIKIQVHSDNQISGDTYSDANGDFEFDISAYAETLEPGEHTIEYSYIDPNTGQEVIKTKTFTVAPKGGQQLALALSPTPRVSPTGAYGTSNPYVPAASGSANASDSAAATAAARRALPSTSSGVPTSGSVGTTWTLILGGLFFMFAGGWSWWIAKEIKADA